MEIISKKILKPPSSCLTYASDAPFENEGFEDMTSYIETHGLKVAAPLFKLVVEKILPGTDISADRFWSGLAGIVSELGPRNKALLERRDEIQARLDAWYRAHPDWEMAAYKNFLKEIGYLVDEGEDFDITTDNVDPEIATLAGPQLVVPVMNARFALNACNARWGSLYDALYGTDVIGETAGLEKSGSYNARRGAEVIAGGAAFLDDIAPLTEGSHATATGYRITDGALAVSLNNGAVAGLAQPEKLVGHTGEATEPTGVLLRNNGLHVEIRIDRAHRIGAASLAGVKDILLEAALTTIQDCEDSVAAVDGADKALAYANWLGLMKGDLEERFEKGGQKVTRRMNPDRAYTDLQGKAFTLPGRSLLLVRNVGHLMTTPAVLDGAGDEIPEGILDAMVTTACALHDFNKNGVNANSRTGSLYIVKPKMHGPEEVAFADDLFARVEDVLGLARDTMKIGVMDEERRTTVNLKECIRAVAGRLVFINTGFLDRTGDEIHTSMEAGPFLPKAGIKDRPWIGAYEDWNVDTGLLSGLKGKAQIGKGMWPMPDEMAQMMTAKIGHPESGANCAWVPSPTAATLHAMHYHKVDVAAVQEKLLHRERADLDKILTVPLLRDRTLTAEEIQSELDNNAQSILGYVVRWIDQGVGCSKVPDINNVGLMEDRATLRISSQHIANWLRHGICSDAQVTETLKRMAAVVDDQNADDQNYRRMAENFDGSIAFRAACDLVFKGTHQPNGYTEPLLHAHRLAMKASLTD